MLLTLGRVGRPSPLDRPAGAGPARPDRGPAQALSSEDSCGFKPPRVWSFLTAAMRSENESFRGASSPSPVCGITAPTPPAGDPPSGAEGACGPGRPPVAGRGGAGGAQLRLACRPAIGKHSGRRRSRAETRCPRALQKEGHATAGKARAELGGLRPAAAGPDSSQDGGPGGGPGEARPPLEGPAQHFPLSRRLASVSFL